ncbi:Type iii restriction-modification system methylation subunit [Oenococcus oeni]|nr:Type iii restriction-modification system methylation subunit [Oenococcus oeni]
MSLDKEKFFNDDPRASERNEALLYIQKLLEKARSGTENKEEDIKELEEIQRLLNQKKYGLVWEQHDEKAIHKMRDQIPIFIEDSQKKIKGRAQDSKYNFLLVGENFYSLHLLRKTHTGKINVIYIDPPYNTGHKDFMYNDQFINQNNEYIHSKWISFMDVRLRQAKELLTYDGIIIIHIDNHEYANLKLLMDEIFPNGYVTTIHVEMSTVQGMKVRSAKLGNIVKNGEYILVYSKNGRNDVMKHPLYDHTNFDGHYNYFLIDKKNYYDCVPLVQVLQKNEAILRQLESLDLVKQGVVLSNSKIGIYYDSSKLVRNFINENADFVVRDHTAIKAKDSNQYVTGKVYHFEHGNREYLIQKNKNGEFTQKIRFSDKLGYSDDFRSEYGPLKIRGDWWKDFYLDMGNINKEGGVSFSNGKKPLRLVEQLLRATTDKNDTILDFFAGSGTTGEAVLDLNKRDGGNRRFILATNNEDQIADKITYQRMLNVNKGYTKHASCPLNLKYFNIGFIDSKNPDLETALLSNVKTLIELRNGVDLKRSDIGIVTNRQELESINLEGINVVYIRGRVRRMLNEKGVESFDNVKLIDIPETFFAKEMRENI